eukprot:g18569.t1
MGEDDVARPRSTRRPRSYIGWKSDENHPCPPDYEEHELPGAGYFLFFGVSLMILVHPVISPLRLIWHTPGSS